MPPQASTPAIHNAGEFEGAAIRARRVPRRFSESRERPAPQRGVWGTDPPDPGSVHTSKTRNLPVLIICRLACHKYLGIMLNPK
jgi:hypothetical protein